MRHLSTAQIATLEPRPQKATARAGKLGPAKHATGKGSVARSFLGAKSPTVADAHHEAAHAVVALAVGAELEGARLTPSPRVGILTGALDAYQLAAVAIAGPLSDAALGLIPRGPGAPGYVAWLGEPPEQDWLLFAGCCWQAVGVELGPVVGENADGWPLAQHPPPSALEEYGGAINAWAGAAELVTTHLCAANRASIAKLARALLAQPDGLSAEQVRDACVPLTTVPLAKLHDLIDELALRGLDAGEKSFREHMRLLPRMTWAGWENVEALKVVQP